MPATTTTKTMPAYSAYSRVFRVEQTTRTGLFLIIGHGRGHKPMYLERLGCHSDAGAAQTALDNWAARYGFKPIEHGGF